MVVTESGMAMLANELHAQKASSPIVVTESGMVILTNEVQSQKALSPIVVTESGMVILTNEVQSQKALSPMVVTESGMVMLQTVAFNTFHASHQSCTMLVVPPGTLKCVRGNKQHPSKA